MTTAAPPASPAWFSAGPVGDALQPARYHAVLDDLVAHSSGPTGRGALAAARARLLSSDGVARALLSQRCDHDRCWVISGPTRTSCLPVGVDAVVLVAACLLVSPATGTVILRRRGRNTAVGCGWRFDLARAAALVTQMADSPGESGDADLRGVVPC